MKQITVKPGDVVVSQFGVYQHWSIVSDRICSMGRNLLISATERTGTVKEETWDTVTQGKHTYVAELNSDKSVDQILFDARSQVGAWSYSVMERNCEHFVKWASGLKVSSRQVKGGAGGAIVGGVAVAALSKNPNAIKILGGAVLLAGLVVWAVKATEKKNIEQSK